MQKEGPSDQRTARLHASALVRPRGVVLPRKHLVPRLQHLHGRRTRREASDRTPDFFWLSDLRAIWGPRSFFFCPRTRSLPVPRAQLLPQHTVTFGGRSNRTVPDPTPYDPERPECTDSLANTAADKCHAAIADPGHVHAVRAQEHARTNATAHFQRLRQWRPALHLRIDLARPFRSTEFPFETVLLKNASV